MDRKRIEWLFFIVFLLIDLYLGIEIWRSPISLSTTAGNASTSIRAEMRADGIDIPVHLSHKQQSGYYLAAKNRDHLSHTANSLTQVSTHYSKSDNSLTGTPKTAVLLNGSHKKILEQLEQFKNDPANVPYGKDFTYDEVRGSTILLPTWLILVENKTTKNVTVKRVNAFTAQILQSGSYNVQKN